MPERSRDAPALTRSTRSDANHTAAKGAKAKINRQLRSYLSAIRWIVRDAWQYFASDIVIIVLLNLIGVAAAAAALGGIILFARHAETGEPMHILGWTIHLRQGGASLVIFGLTLMALGVLSAAILYVVEVQVLRTARRYQKFCSRRVLEMIVDERFRGWPLLIKGSPVAAASRLIGQRSRFVAFALRDALRGLLPIITLLIAGGFLVYADAILTVMLLPVAGLYLAPLYLINRNVAAHHRQYQQGIPAVRSRLQRELKRSLSESSPTSAKRNWAATALDSAGYRTVMGLYYARMVANKRVQWLNSTIFMVCVCGTLLYFSVGATSYGRPWSDLLLYLLALRFAIAALRQVTAMFVRLSRLFPEYNEYARFAGSAQAMRAKRDAEPAQPLPETLTIRLGRNAAWNSPSRIVWRQSAVLLALMPERARHIEFELALLAIAARTMKGVDLVANRDVFVHAGAELDPRLTLLENAAGPNPSSREVESVMRAMREFGVASEIERLPKQLQTKPQERDGFALTPDATFVLQTGAAWLQGPELAALNALSLRELSPEVVSKMLGCLDRSFVLLADTRVESIELLPAPLAARVEAVVVIHDGRIRGGGDAPWLRTHADEIGAYLKSAADELSHTHADAMVDDDELDE